jgi:aarF domain-containing kinase
MALCRILSLPTSLRLSLLGSPNPTFITARRASNWSRLGHTTFPSFFNHTPIPRFSLGRKALWLIPLAGGLTLYLAPRTESLLPSVFASPTLIPCPSPAVPNPITPTIFSPSESDLSITSRILALLRNKIWEPILTAKRFIYLFALFMPVIICSPMLLVGKSEKKYMGDRWGAVWWYGLLVSKMETAGPTFIKVCPLPFPACPTKY